MQFVPYSLVANLESDVDWTRYMKRLPTSHIGPFLPMYHISRPCLTPFSNGSEEYVVPTENTIKSRPHPEEWDRENEAKPLACSIAWGSHVLTYSMPPPTIHRKTLTYLFATYTRERSVPSLERINYVFTQIPVEAGILNLRVDLYLKYYGRGCALNGPLNLFWNLAEFLDRFQRMLPERMQIYLEEYVCMTRGGWRLKLSHIVATREVRCVSAKVTWISRNKRHR
jgi:hypothetical protein